MLYFLAIINIIFISSYAYRCREEIIDTYFIVLENIISKAKYCFGEIFPMSIGSLGNYHWTISSDMYGSIFTTASYSQTMSISNGGFGAASINISPGTIVGNNLTLGNYQHQISISELINMKNTLDSLQKDFHETKYKHSIRINDLEKENEE